MLLRWNTLSLEVARRDYTFDHAGSLNPAASPTGRLVPDQGGPTRTSRALAIVHIAMYNAVAGVSGGLPPYTVGGAYEPPNQPDVAAGIDVNAAIAAAAAAALSLLWPSQTGYISAQLQEALGLSTEKANNGVKYGTRLGQLAVTSRGNDGHTLADAPIFNPAAPHHQPDPVNPGQPRLGTHWGMLPPFCIAAAAGGAAIHSAYVVPPPAYGTPRYEAALADVKALGSGFSTTRTKKESENGIFWGYDGGLGVGVPPRLYNQIVVAMVSQHAAGTWTLQELASLFAQVNAGMADAAIVAWSAKYAFDLWRPVVGIRRDGEGHGAGGPSAAAQPDWMPLGAPRTNVSPGEFFRTPEFPAYPSGHATFGATALSIAARALARKSGISYDEALTARTITFTSEEFNGANSDASAAVRPAIPRAFTLQRAIIDNAISRVHLGVHWRFDGIGTKPWVQKLGLADLNDPASAHSLPDAIETKLGGVPAGLMIAAEVFDKWFH